MAETIDYPLDLNSPVSYVATLLRDLFPEEVHLDEHIENYQHPVTGDLARVRKANGLRNNAEAIRWLLGRATEELEFEGKTARSRRQLVRENGSVRFAPGVTLDDLRFRGKRVYPVRNDHALFRDPFNPMSGVFSENIRKNTGKDSMDELRESLREFGWVPEFPALVDERGVVLVGHRRLKVAAELGIEPVIEVIPIGAGDAGDARRFRVALVSNLGFKPMTPDERARIAEYLYGDRDWSQARIAEALNVSQGIISRDLDLLPSNKSTNRGRPRKYEGEEEERLGALVLEEGLPVTKAEQILRPDEPVRDWPTKGALMAVERQRGKREAPLTIPDQASDCTCPRCGHDHVSQIQDEVVASRKAPDA